MGKIITRCHPLPSRPTMTPLSFTPTISSTIIRRRLHKSTADLSLSPPSSISSSHWISPKLAPILHVHILYRTRTSSPPSSSCFAATGGALLQDAGATAAVLAGAYGLVLTFDNLTQRQVIQQVAHLLAIVTDIKQKTGPYIIRVAFCYFLANFQDSTSTEARYFASVVPLVNCFRLLIYGFSFATDEGLIKSVTRQGNPEELLRGPLYYVLILILCALVFWRESPIGLISLAMMCGGDGVADIMGRRFGSIKLPYNQQKSWAGSISMFVCGFLVSLGMLYYYSALGYFQLDWLKTTQRIAFVALVATVVESFPITEVVDDNISVPLVTIVAAYLAFCY